MHSLNHYVFLFLLARHVLGFVAFAHTTHRSELQAQVHRLAYSTRAVMLQLVAFVLLYLYESIANLISSLGLLQKGRDHSDRYPLSLTIMPPERTC